MKYMILFIPYTIALLRYTILFLKYTRLLLEVSFFRLDRDKNSKQRWVGLKIVFISIKYML